MYIGRIVAIGRTAQGSNAAMYRVSSRSFPNRRIVRSGDQLAVIPREGCEADLAKNPYISYNCLRLAGEWAIATNGSQTDPITEKIAAGMPVRDAIALGLLALDFEHDSLDTPRIVAVAHRADPVGFLGIVRRDALLVREFKLEPGQGYFVSTYERNCPCDRNREPAFNATTAEAAAQFVIDGGVFAEFTNPVTACAAVADGKGFALAF
ncbi:MAG: IMP cyclohydrolase, partial [Lentisphaeria bacterium]|nr:IMP cyclohydrolase [Lentisphaeria bacterium]